MAQLAFANSFWETYDRLEKPVKAGVRKAMAKFQQLPIAELYADKGLHLESVHNARDPRMRTIRITDFWRGVVLAPDDGSDIFLLINVSSHDDAYDWAAKQLFTVNTATRGLEVRNVVAIEQLTPTLAAAASEAPELLFEKHSDTVLRGLGIDDQVLSAARMITGEKQLDAFGHFLPEDQFEVLQYLAEGFSPDDVYHEIVASRRPADSGSTVDDSLSMAIVNTHSRITLVSGPEELEEILSKPFALWRVYLHRSQRRVAYRRSYNGSAQVTGGPGTGKTVVALHRVKHLLSQNPEARILLTTFTNALASSLWENLQRLLDDDRLLDRVEITTVDSLANRAVRESTGKGLAPINDVEERQLWRRVVNKLTLPWSEQFMMQEYRHVILAQDISTEAQYLAAKRRGRGSQLRGEQRKLVWRGVEEFLAELDRRNNKTHLQICAQAADLISDEQRFDHIVVDEAQDLHPAQWRLLRAAVPTAPDDLFITGDPHQRIYDNRVSLRSLGINVISRSSRLRLNYRSTAEILSWSTKLLGSEPVEDLGGDGSDSLAGYRSLLSGRRPQVMTYPSENEEVTALAEQIRSWTDQGVPTNEIAVSARFNVLLDKVAERLNADGLPTVRVKNRPRAEDNGVRLATMHAMKGLEFRCVAVVGATAKAVPFDKDITPEELDPQQHRNDLFKQRCLLFVACTRAREELTVSSSGTPSPFLPA
ncbi:UvrD-helicase domain-containing protein [Saccharopolyspora indica]|uniref:UvrD-helicase domain-containing protein n=1 Tax=Saccharopolyspora indica TaxID=1229659 RepID=UPI0022EACDB0|nr:UvrD-helicase domain-containing protein [Saccharopolyspora indica]MDA3647121.1 UvrD-helicase domain-containing protein [Saccharopolyspora indica]